MYVALRVFPLLACKLLLLHLSTSFSLSSLSSSLSSSLAASTTSVMNESDTQMQDIVIIGGGISGLATALALQNAGKESARGGPNSGYMKNVGDIHIIEKSNMKSFLSLTKGAGAQITPNGLRALKYIDDDNDSNDLMKQVIDSSCTLEGSAFIMASPPPSADGEEGSTKGQEEEKEPKQNMMFVEDTTKEEFNLPQVFIRWALLRNILYSSVVNNNKSVGKHRCPKVVLHTNTGKDIIGYKINDENNFVSLVSKSGKDADINSNNIGFIIGADGLSSTFRYLVNNNEQTIPPEEEMSDRNLRQIDVKDTGRINIKAVVRKELDISKGFKPNHTFVHFTSNGIGVFAGSAGDQYTYWAISISDDVDGETGEKVGFLSETVKEWREKRSNNDDINDDIDENEELDILFHEKVKAELLGKLQNLDCPKDVQFAIDLIEATDPNVIFLTRSQEAISIGPRLNSNDNKCVLVGDAAHCMSGSYGQNPNLALEDAAVLAACLRDSQALPNALKKFSESRVSRCLEMQQRSAERAAKAMKGEKAEDVSKWIFQWKLNQN